MAGADDEEQVVVVAEEGYLPRHLGRTLGPGAWALQTSTRRLVRMFGGSTASLFQQA